MAEQSHQVRVIEVDYTCDKCAKGAMRPTGYVLTSNPPQYPHACTECGHRDTFSGAQYPSIRYERVKP